MGLERLERHSYGKKLRYEHHVNEVLQNNVYRSAASPLQGLHDNYSITSIDKVTGNIAFICNIGGFMYLYW